MKINDALQFDGKYSHPYRDVHFLTVFFSFYRQ